VPPREAWLSAGRCACEEYSLSAAAPVSRAPAPRGRFRRGGLPLGADLRSHGVGEGLFARLLELDEHVHPQDPAHAHLEGIASQILDDAALLPHDPGVALRAAVGVDEAEPLHPGEVRDPIETPRRVAPLLHEGQLGPRLLVDGDVDRLLRADFGFRARAPGRGTLAALAGGDEQEGCEGEHPLHTGRDRNL